MDPVWLTAAAILALLVLSGFFSGSETALTAMSRAAMHRRAEQGSAGARTALTLTEDSETLIGAILLGNNLVNVLATALATALFTTLLGEAGIAWATLAMTAMVTIYAEVMPKTYAITSPERTAERVAPVIAVVKRVFGPVVAVVRLVVRLTLRLFGIRPDPDAHVLAHDEIRGAIDLHHAEGAVEKDDRDRLIAALDLRNRGVFDVMRHRRKIEAISMDEPPEAIIDFCLTSPYTRIPVWREQPDNIKGVIHAKDLLREVNRLVREGGAEALARFDVASVTREPWFVPDTTSLDEQMREFIARRSHFALVVDEYGDLQGLITLEDILEEIVGDIADEHDVEAEIEGVRREPDGSYVIDGATPVRDLNRQLDWKLPDDVATTIAGLVIYEAETIPTVGQVFRFHDCRFEILERARNQITSLRVKPTEKLATAG